MKQAAIIDNYISGAEVYELTERRVICRYADDKYRDSKGNGGYAKNAFYHSHGTICASILAEYLPAAVQIHALSVSNKKGEIEMDHVCAALRWCRENNMDYISMSIGTETWGNTEKLAYETKKLHEAGVRLFCACSNSGVLSFPSAFPWVTGVAYSENLCGIAECRESLSGVNLIAGYFPSDVLKQVEKEDAVYAKRSSSMAVPYILSYCVRKEFSHKMVQLEDDSVLWRSEIRLPKQINTDIDAPVVKLIGSHEANRGLVLFFQKAGYRTGVVTNCKEEGNLWSGIIRVRNGYEMERAVRILAGADIVFLDMEQEDCLDETMSDAVFETDLYTAEEAYKAIRKMFEV